MAPPLRKPSTPKAAPLCSVGGKGERDAGKSINFRVQALASSLFKGAQQFYGTWVDLSVPELRIISSLDSDGPLTATELVAFTAMDKALVSRVLAALAGRGLIVVEPVAQSRRRAWMASPACGQLVRRMRPIWKRREDLLQEQLNEGERNQLRRLLDLLFKSSEALRLAEADALNPNQHPKPASRFTATPLMQAHLRWIRRMRQDAGTTPNPPGKTAPPRAAD